MICPCKDCNARVLGCHSECDAYQEFSNQCEKLREKRKSILQSTYFSERIDKAHGK